MTAEFYAEAAWHFFLAYISHMLCSIDLQRGRKTSQGLNFFFSLLGCSGSFLSAGLKKREGRMIF